MDFKHTDFYKNWKKIALETFDGMDNASTVIDWMETEVVNHYKALYRSMQSKAEGLIDRIESFNGIDTTDKKTMELAFTELFCEQDKVQDFIDYWDEKETGQVWRTKRPLSDMRMDELIDFIHIGQPDVDAPYSDFEEVINQIRADGIGAFDFSDTPAEIVFKQIDFLRKKGFDLP